MVLSVTVDRIYFCVLQQIEDAEKQHIMVDEQRQRDLLDTQKEALAMQQAAMIESEKRQMLEQQQLVSAHCETSLDGEFAKWLWCGVDTFKWCR